MTLKPVKGIIGKEEMGEIFRMLQPTFELDGATYPLPEKFQERDYSLEKRGHRIGDAKMEIVYVRQIEQGYRHETNAVTENLPYPECSVKNLVEKYASQGFDVFVGDRAFGRDGKEIQGLKAIFVRTKSLDSKVLS